MRGVLEKLAARHSPSSAMEGYASHWAALPYGERHAALKQVLSRGNSWEFALAVRRNRKIPAALRRQVDLLAKREVLGAKASVRATPKSKGGKDGRRRYKLSYDPARRRWLCTCPDWVHRRSYLPDSRKTSEKNCKHIKAYLRRRKR